MSRASDAFVTVQNGYDNGWQAAREMEKVAHKFECEADQAHEELAAEKDVVSSLQAEVAAWQKWASSSRCIYCDAEFTHNPINQDEADELKKAHILVCPEHPYGGVKEAIELRDTLLRIATAFTAQHKDSGKCDDIGEVYHLLRECGALKE